MIEKNKLKVLLVPAWYPEITNPLLGSFFQEQMRLLKDDFDFKVLVGQRFSIGKKTAIKQILKGNFIYTERVDNKYTQQEQTIAIDYFYIKSLPKKIEKKQYARINKVFDKLYCELTNSEWKPDLIHIQSLSDTAVFACNLGEKYQIPVILTEHNVYSFRGNNDFFEIEKQKVYERVSKVLCVSNHVFRHLLINNFNLKYVSIVGNLLNDNQFLLNNKKTESSKKQIVFVAGHLGCKDIHILIQTAQYLVKIGFTDFVINIVGLDADKSYYYYYTNSNYSIKEEIEKFELRDYFVFKGLIPWQNMLLEYQNNSILLSTSFSETFGLSIAEALLCGLPVVCTDSGGPRDFVNESNGIIVPVRDPQALGDAIIHVCKNISNYKREKISDEIRKCYGVESFTKSISSEYRKAIYD